MLRLDVAAPLFGWRSAERAPVTQRCVVVTAPLSHPVPRVLEAPHAAHPLAGEAEEVDLVDPHGWWGTAYAITGASGSSGRESWHSPRTGSSPPPGRSALRPHPRRLRRIFVAGSLAWGM